MNILVVEDDTLTRNSVVQGLTEAGHTCVGTGDGERGLSLADEKNPDLIVLDLMLPGRSGLEVLKELRQRGQKMPVILLSARGSVGDRVNGLNCGADDYVVKPFSFIELLARIEAVTRRAHERNPLTLTAADMTLDLTTRRVECGGQVIELTPTEFSILEMLMRFAGQVVTRQALCEHVWGFRWEGNTNVIEVHVNRLRQKLDFGNEPSRIQTVRGRGYAIRAPE
jgi:two-component system OmpR family response regulator/two-component system copper resistance phosphate regulon response regulator CusR